MSEELNKKYGLLMHGPDIKLNRKYFEEMCYLLGVRVLYYAPRPDKHWTTYSEIKSNYYEPIIVNCIFEEHPNHNTMKKLGWDMALQEASSLISVPYDLKLIQVGALFLVPSSLDNTTGNLFRVTKLYNQMIYPSSLTCEIVPEYEDAFSNETVDYKNSSMTLLNEEEGYD